MTNINFVSQLFLAGVISISGFTCNQDYKKQSKIPELKNAIGKWQDPYESKIPDSLRFYITIFDSIIKRDQKYRSVNDPALYIKYKKEQDVLDSINKVRVKYFLQQYGYPTLEQAGAKGRMAINLVMQHASLEDHFFYYPMYQQGFKNGEVGAQLFAMYEDKLNAQMRRRQYYGTQVLVTKDKQKKTFLYPVVNYDSIDIYRKQIGYDAKLADELKNFYNTSITKQQYQASVEKNLKEWKVNDSAALRFIPVKQ